MGHQGMKSSLVSREVIADSIELTMRGHCYDAIVGIAGCDKSLPGIMMAMLRLNVPSVFMYGGSILPGRFQGRDVTVVDVFEGVGMYSAGRMTAEELHDLECHACPSGSCGGQFTANTMACVSEAIGLALPGSAGAPAPVRSRRTCRARQREPDRFGHAGHCVGSELAAARARGRASVAFEIVQLLRRHAAGGIHAAPSNTSTTDVAARNRPGRIEPPYMKTDGTLRRSIAIMIPGSDLSQPAMPTIAS